MNQVQLELLILLIAGLNALITIYILWTAHKQGRFKKALLGMAGGVGVAFAVIFSGMIVSLLAQFFIDYPVEIALGVVLGAASCAVPLTTWLVKR